MSKSSSRRIRIGVERFDWPEINVNRRSEHPERDLWSLLFKAQYRGVTSEVDQDHLHSIVDILLLVDGEREEKFLRTRWRCRWARWGSLTCSSFWKSNRTVFVPRESVEDKLVDITCPLIVARLIVVVMWNVEKEMKRSNHSLWSVSRPWRHPSLSLSLSLSVYLSFLLLLLLLLLLVVWISSIYYIVPDGRGRGRGGRLARVDRNMKKDGERERVWHRWITKEAIFYSRFKQTRLEWLRKSIGMAVVPV